MARDDPPPLCGYHHPLYTHRLAKLHHHVKHPDGGRKALMRQAQQISDQCCRKALGLPPRWRP